MQPNRTVTADPTAPTRTFGYHLYTGLLRLLKLISCCMLLINIGLYILAIKACVNSNGFGAYEKSFTVLSGMGFMAMSIMQIIAEIGPRWYLNRVAFMKIMFIRGILMAWQGIQTIDNKGSDAGRSVVDIDHDVFDVLSNVVGWTLIACGMLFMIICTCQIKRIVGIEDGEETNKADERKPLAKNQVQPPAPTPKASPMPSSDALSPEARIVISNMAIALGITSSSAWDLFSGPGGAEEARRIRAEKAQLQAAANESYSHAPPAHKEHAPSSSSYSAQHSPAEVNHNPRHARLLANDDAALAAQYYGIGK